MECVKYLQVDIEKNETKHKIFFKKVFVFTMQSVVVHTLLNDDNNLLMMMEQKLFVVIVMHNMHLMQLDYLQNLDA